MKTTQEIKDEIGRLENILPKVRDMSYFGDDNRGAVEAQIQVLTDILLFTTDILGEIAVEYGDDEYVEEQAMYAFYWANDEEDIAPSEDWYYLC